MRILIIALLISLSVSAKNWTPYKILAVSIGSNVLMGIGDGLKDSGRKTQGHIFDAAGVGLLAASPIILNIQRDDWLKYGVSFVAVRFAVFDASYNLTRGLPLFYNGKTSYYDKMFSKMPPHMKAFHKGISLTIGIHLATKIKTRYKHNGTYLY